MKKKVLFICTHNSARSQMAKGFLMLFMEVDMKVLVLE